MTDTLIPEFLIAESLRETARRYGMAPGIDAIDYFPEAEAWAARIAAHLANHGYGLAARSDTAALDVERLARAIDLSGIGMAEGGRPASDWAAAIAREYAAGHR